LGLADARTQAKEALAAVVAGDDPAMVKKTDRSAMSFGELADDYIDRHAKPKKRTWRDDKRMLEKYVPKDWRRTNAADIRRRDTRDLLDSMVGKTPILANRVLALLRKVYNFALSRDLVDVNPCEGIERPAPERQRDRVNSIHRWVLVARLSIGGHEVASSLAGVHGTVSVLWFPVCTV
jgi:hypothetical protein